MWLESIFMGVVGILALIFLVILTGVLFVVYIGVSSVLFRLSWLIHFYKKYQPNLIELEKAWLEYIKKYKRKLTKDIKKHKIEALDPKEWEERNK